MSPLQYSFPRLRYDWLPEYAELGRRIKLRPGQSLSIVGRMVDVPDDIFLQGIGQTHLLVNDGVPDPTPPAKNRALIINGGSLLDLRPFYDRTKWTDAAINSYVNSLRDAGFITDEIREKLDNLGYEGWNEPFIGTQPNETDTVFGQFLQAKLNSLGPDVNAKYYGGYDGAFTVSTILTNSGSTSLNGLNALRALLKWQNVPLNNGGNKSPKEAMKELSTTSNGFYRKEQYQFRHGSIKIYGTANDDVFEMAMNFVISFDIDRVARQNLAPTRRTAVIAWPGYNEVISRENPWNSSYRRTVQAANNSTNTGVLTRSTAPMWSYSIQIGVYFLALAMDFDFFSWESADRYGRNPTVTDLTYGGDKPGEKPTYSGDPSIITSNGNTKSQRAGEAVVNRDTMFPLNPQGVLDLPLVAADMYTFINQYAGFNGVWVTHRIITGSETELINSAWTVVGADYLIDRFAYGTPRANFHTDTTVSAGIAMLFKPNSGPPRGVFYINMALEAWKSERVEIDLQDGGLTLVFRAYGGVPYSFAGPSYELATINPNPAQV